MTNDGILRAVIAEWNPDRGFGMLKSVKYPALFREETIFFHISVWLLRDCGSL